MKEFKILIKGRLDNGTLSEITGGENVICTPGKELYNQSCAQNHVTCPNFYKSCYKGLRLSCNLAGGYVGTPGGGGLVDAGGVGDIYEPDFPGIPGNGN